MFCGHLPVVGPLERGPCQASGVGGSNKCGRSLKGQRCCPESYGPSGGAGLGQLCLWSTVGRESGAVTCRKRVLARDGQGLVMVEAEKLGR